MLDRKYVDSSLLTKASMIQYLSKEIKHAYVYPPFVFTVADWREWPAQIIACAQEHFNGQTVIVRSSAISEDGLCQSQAGEYHSVMNVAGGDSHALSAAINRVAASYVEKANYNPDNQIFIQKQELDVMISGVVLTRRNTNNAPYYLINYDDNSRRTNTVTAGRATKQVEILHGISPALLDAPWSNLILAVQEVEGLLGDSFEALDIEFAVNKAYKVTLFQARSLTLPTKRVVADVVLQQHVTHVQHRYYEYGQALEYLDGACLSDMAFWNPAEIIGRKPHPLDHSLYLELILRSKWNEGIAAMGYTRIDAPLMVELAGSPYIDVRLSCLSLLPESLSDSLKARLVAYYTNKIKQYPYLHDKIEFEVVHNCFTFNSKRSFEELSIEGFNEHDIAELEASLRSITRQIIHNSQEYYAKGRSSLQLLNQRRQEQLMIISNNHNDYMTCLRVAKQIFDDCCEYGITPFVQAARMSFIGKSLIESLYTAGAISQTEYEQFFSSFTTVLSDFVHLHHEQNFEALMDRFGHLRPGTYDITKLPYSKRGFPNSPYVVNNVKPVIAALNLDEKLAQACSEACEETGFEVDAACLLEFIRSSIKAREAYKLEFTASLSAAIELIAEAGEQLGFTRQELAMLDYNSVFSSPDEWRDYIHRQSKKYALDSCVSLPGLISSSWDFQIIHQITARPTFITSKIVKAELIQLQGYHIAVDGLAGKIIVIENADPGYDWIFACRIAGLVTKYGGVASHMAIRCNELQIPAAIGCGEVLYAHVCGATELVLDAARKEIEIL